MFAALAGFTARYKYPITIFWIALAVALVILAPSLSSVGITDDTQFLPRDTESSRARTLLEQKFPSAPGDAAGSALVVVHNPRGLSGSDLQTARDLGDWLKSKDAPSVISGVTSVFDNEALKSTLESADQTTMLLQIDLSEASSSAPSREAVAAIRSHVQGLISAPEIYITGNAGISTDALNSIQQTIDKATLVTVMLVIFLLLLIYRSPVAMLVPLVTIGVSYLVSRGITGFIAGAGVNISSLVDAYLVVTLFGIGTDYCLFLVSRFKEELLNNERGEAGHLALRRIGPVILASAATVIVALLCLGISRFGMNRTSGLMLAIGVAVTLLAGLTLTPALISIFGRILLWPAKLVHRRGATDNLWQRIGRQITSRPIALLVPILVLLAVPYFALPKINYSVSLLSQMPSDMGSVKGYDILKTHFSTGTLDPLILVIESSDDLRQAAALQSTGKIADSLKTIEGVADATFSSEPVNQLLDLSRQSRAISDSLSISSINQLSFFQSLGQDLQNMALRYPGVIQSTNFKVAVANLQQISVVAAKINPSAPQQIPDLIAQIKQAATGVGSELEALSAEFNMQGSGSFTDWLNANYYSTDGKLTRINIALKADPYSRESFVVVDRVRAAAAGILPSSGLSGAVSYLGGTAADQSDILSVNGSDFIRVLILTMIGIFAVTALLLRSLLAPLYMLFTVLFNFGATLGIATWLFLDVLGQNTIIYMLPIFVFVILIAVGSDYNIFLVSRIREESHQHPSKEAIRISVANTGAVITSCGIILAGTFATLTSAPLQMVFQVGAAIAIGVLIDTFLVRAIVIPSLATLFGRWNWWPSRLYRRTSSQPAASDKANNRV